VYADTVSRRRSLAVRIVEPHIEDGDVARRSIIACCVDGVVGPVLFASAADARWALAGVVLATGCANPGAVVRAMTEIWVNRRTISGVRATVHSPLSLAEHVGEITFGSALAAAAATTGLTASGVGLRCCSRSPPGSSAGPDPRGRLSVGATMPLRLWKC
jgi:hypothetical protein